MITKHILLNGRIDYETITPFLEQINQCYFDQQGLIIQYNFCIYLNSHGGEVSAEMALTHMINSQPERFTLIANGEISSSAFSLFFNAKCDKMIFPGTFGMYHLSRREILYTQNGQGYFDDDKFHMQDMPSTLQESLYWCENLGMTAKEIERIAQTDNQYFNTKRLKELVENGREKERADSEAAGRHEKSQVNDRVFEIEKVNPAYCNGQTHDNCRPSIDDQEPPTIT